MSTLSKVFVVINFVVAIMFMVASLTLYAKKINWVENSRLSDIERNKLLTENDKIQKEFQALRESSSNTITKQERDLENLSADVSKKAAQIETLTQANTKLSEQISDINTKIGTVNATLNDFQEQNNGLRTENAGLKKERDEAILAREFAEKQAIETVADLKEAEDELLQLAKKNHGLVDRVMEQDQVIEKAREQGLISDTATTAAEAIAARVLKVDETIGIVILNVGQKNNVKPGMEFVISRGDKYVGKVRVRNTYADMSSAVVIQDMMKSPIQISDLAQTM